MDESANAALRRKIMGGIVAQAIHAVTVLGVIDRLATGPMAIEELAAELGIDHDALRRFARALVAEGLFTEPRPGTVALTPMGALLRSDVPGSLRHFSTLMCGEAYRVWELAPYSLRTGEPAFPVMFGKSLFEWLTAHPDKAREFNDAQAGLVELRLMPLLDHDWDGVSTVVDVGAGSGLLLSVLLARYPRLRGIAFDLPSVVAQATGLLTEAGVADRCRCVGGDFFTAVPGGGDAYVLAQILHDWDDTQALAILRRCRAAMPDGARLLVLEHVIRGDDRPHPAKLLDLHMLVLLGGRERTEESWRELFDRAGFAVTGITHSSLSSLIEARPR
jgi:hypothetical protein